MTVTWSAEQVLALAPDASSQKAGRGLATPGPWRDVGHSTDPAALWGFCKGSGANPYQTCVDLTGPAYRCSCPSRKFPCKHALGLMLLWSGGSVPEVAPPEWVTQWLDSRAARQQKAQTVRAPRTADPATAAKRENSVDAGVSELERWLADQVRAGLAAAGRADYRHWDSMAARLVDAKAPGLAGSVRRLASVAGAPERLFTEVSLLWLLVRAYRRLAELPPGLAETVRSRIGFPVATADVLAGPRVRDEWAVLGVRDEIDERLTVRRVWLRGRSGQYALVLSFAAPGQSLPADLVPGTSIDASLCFYLGARPLRAPHGLSTVRALGRGQVGAAMTPWATLLAAAGAARPLPFARRAAAAGRGGRWGSGALAGRAESGVDILHPGVEETADPSAWETGSPAQRRGYLATLRRQDPAAARARLTDGWATLAATERADLLQTLAIGLGPDDEPLLQSALDDRRKEVRVVAADLLTVLPGSAYQERAIARARHHLVVDGTRVDVRLPARGRPRRLP